MYIVHCTMYSVHIIFNKYTPIRVGIQLVLSFYMLTYRFIIVWKYIYLYKPICF